MAVIYSYGLEETKKKNIAKRVDLELEEIEDSLKKYAKRTFKCRTDADIEKAGIMEKTAGKLTYHNLDLSVTEIAKRRPGRLGANSENDTVSVKTLEN